MMSELILLEQPFSLPQDASIQILNLPPGLLPVVGEDGSEAFIASTGLLEASSKWPSLCSEAASLSIMDRSQQSSYVKSLIVVSYGDFSFEHCIVACSYVKKQKNVDLPYQHVRLQSKPLSLPLRHFHESWVYKQHWRRATMHCIKEAEAPYSKVCWRLQRQQ